MFGRIWGRVRPAIFWSYRRGSWQYDVIVAVILAFIFLVPKSVFNDRPSPAVVQEIGATPDGERVFWIDPGALDLANPDGADATLVELIQSKGGEGLEVVRTEPATDEAGNVRAYLVYVEP